MTEATLKAEKNALTQDEPWTLQETSQLKNQDHKQDFNPSEPYRGIEEPDIEVDLAETSFPVTEGQVVKVLNPNKNPVQILYKVKEEAFEVQGWELTVPLEDFPRLPQEIGRRFMQLYCASQDGTLAPEDEKALERVSEQMDYRDFAAKRLVPRRLEATMVRTEPVVLIEFLDDKHTKLPQELAMKLEVLKPGDRFAAYFDLDGDGKVLDIHHIDLLPTLDSLGAQSDFDTFDS